MHRLLVIFKAKTSRFCKKSWNLSTNSLKLGKTTGSSAIFLISSCKRWVRGKGQKEFRTHTWFSYIENIASFFFSQRVYLIFWSFRELSNTHKLRLVSILEFSKETKRSWDVWRTVNFSGASALQGGVGEGRLNVTCDFGCSQLTRFMYLLRSISHHN